MIHIAITQEAIDLNREISSSFHGSCCGAYAWFAGVVREENEGQSVVGIDYECYEAMAKKELDKIFSEAQKEWGIHEGRLIHRVGYLKKGEVSLFVGVTSPHRREAFSALQYVIDELKKRVPLWKKEYYEAGHQEWISCHHGHG